MSAILHSKQYLPNKSKCVFDMPDFTCPPVATADFAYIRFHGSGALYSSRYTDDELARGDQLVFAASGVTKGELLDGVTFIPNGAIVESLCTRLPSGTIEKSRTTVHFVGHPVYKGFGIQLM